MSKFWVITKDVYRKNVRSISFIIMLLVPFIAAAGLYIINQVTDNATEEGDTIGVVVQGDSDLLNTVEVQTVLDSMTVLNSKEQGEEQLKEEEIDGLLLLSVEKEQINGEFYSSNTMPQVTMALNQQLNQLQSSLRAKALGLSEEEVASLNASVPFSVQKITFNENGEMNTEEDFTSIRLVVGMATTILLFIFIVTYASIIAQEIASEKGTRIMEVILSSVSARSHFYGKLAGILLVALTQIVVYAVSIGLGFYWLKNNSTVQAFLAEFSIRDILGEFLVYTLLYLILGILIYAVLAALCGSLVSKVEDVSKAILPVTYLSLAGYMIGLSLGMANPDHLVIRVTSFIPFFSSYTMPIRLANNFVSTGEVLLSLMILVLSIVGLIIFSERMYKANVLVYNDNGIFAALKQSVSLMTKNKSGGVQDHE
ncbi:MAG: ABC transporter permease [Enterococcus sp.]|nr:ABC transporter permease [Enterococcus sp.]MBP8693257.1 ABC transporter permease [Enterococcus sp.]MBP9521059.1 ABC transporter permease [Enterococcus sp.]MBP9638731.1 ABC transporter permease [Enterococcus sp.]HRM23627.1 ABC transporter permease [Enterococcus aquimarinus]